MTMRLALAAFLAFLPCYSYSEPYSYGTTNNAATYGFGWDMYNVLPNVAGVEVNGIFYRYTVEKQTEDDMRVTVGNDGVFSLTDDWSSLPSNTITRGLSFDNIPARSWGDGSITVDGDGEVRDATVIYSYRIDECADPKLSPSCEGYLHQIDTPDLYDYNEAIDIASQETDLLSIDYEEEEQQEEVEKKSRLELGLASAENALTIGIDQSAILEQINSLTNLAMYYNTQINGGQYEDAPMLVDAEFPENKRALRNNLAQQALHAKMVQEQYEDR